MARLARLLLGLTLGRVPRVSVSQRPCVLSLSLTLKSGPNAGFRDGYVRTCRVYYVPAPSNYVELKEESNIREDKKSYSDQEFAVILSKASELARSSDAVDHSPAGHSLEEMKAVAVEVGLDPALIERAARLMPVGLTESRLERVLGGPVKHRLDAHFATRLTEERTAHLLSAVRAAVEQQGEGEASSSGMSWNSVGEGSQMFVTAHTEGVGTRVRVMVDRKGALVIAATASLSAHSRSSSSLCL